MRKLSAYTIAKNCSDLSDVESGISELNKFFQDQRIKREKIPDWAYIRYKKLHLKKENYESRAKKLSN